MRHVCLEKFEKSDLVEKEFSLMAMVAISSLSESELSSFEFLVQYELHHRHFL
jgi:hypothetical protein